MPYQPQQSVLYPHAGHRHTACILNISAPQRSHATASLPIWAAVFGGGDVGFSGRDMVGLIIDRPRRADVAPADCR